MNQFCSTSGQTLNHINSGCTLHRELLDASLLVMLSEHIYGFNFNDLVVFLARACDNGCAGFLVSCCNFALLNIDLLGGGVLSCGWIHNSVKPEPCIDSSRQEAAPASAFRPEKRGGGGGGGGGRGNAASKRTAGHTPDTATLLNRHCQTRCLLGGELSKKMMGKAHIVLPALP